jgi:8-oxo-dGTP pyrophosphatase MutT (NUDIX family)
VEPRDAATVMLVRDTPDLHVFMLRRNPRSEFVAGAYVFPGGAVDEEDSSPELIDRCHGRDPVGAELMLGLQGALRFWVAAIRESFEEAGVLVARDAAGEPVDIDAEGVPEALAADRIALLARERSFVDIVKGHDAFLDAGALAPVGHWITPEPAPRRYDTWFFVAPAPEGHVYEHDDDETVASVWMRPLDALAAARDKRIELIYPTYRSLQSLAAFSSSADLLEAVDAVWRDDPEPMRTVDRGEGRMLNLDMVDDAALAREAREHSSFTAVRPGRV